MRLLILVSLLLLTAACSKNSILQSSTAVPHSFAQFASEEDEESLLTPTPDCNIKCQELRQEFRYTVYVGKKIYCYWEMKQRLTGTDYDLLASELEASIKTETSHTEYFVILQRWAASFFDGHVNAMVKKDFSEYEVYSAPVRLEVLAPATEREKVVVVALPSGEADVLGLSSQIRVGDEVLAINGVQARAAVDEASKMVSGSTARMRRKFSSSLLVDVRGRKNGVQPLVLTVQGPKGINTVQIPRNVTLYPKTDAAAPTDWGTGADRIKVMVLPGEIGYLRIDGFAGSQQAFLLSQAMTRLIHTKGIIIDVRRNGGGDLSGNGVIKRLISDEVIRYKVSERVSDYLVSQWPYLFALPRISGTEWAAWHDHVVKPDEKLPRFKGPVVVLTGGGCFSACDTFIVGLKSNNLVTVVGEGTAGGTGSPLNFDLPFSNFSFRYSVVRGTTPSGEFIESVGTVPEVLIEPTIEERRQGRDLQLLKAVDVFVGKISNSESIPQESIERALKVVRPVWEQTLDVAPTIQEALELNAIAPIDEKYFQ